MKSRRLRYRPLCDVDADTFHAIVADSHVKRYLFDGETMTRQWCLDAIATSERTFAESGLGLWLLELLDNGAAIGFGGYYVFPELGPELQLLYALTGTHTNKGYATEAALALIEVARDVGMTRIHAAVDEPNRASLRVLEKVGFTTTGSAPGAFGKTLTLIRHL